MSDFKEVNISVEKVDGGFIVYINKEDFNRRLIVRKLSEVVALVKEHLADEVKE